MAYNTKAIKTDVNTKPIPQYYNPATDEYEPLQGANGAARHVLYGSDGNPISTDFATQTTLAAILAKIIAAPATEAKQTALNALIGEVQAAPTENTLLARLKNLETKVDAIIADGVKLSGRNEQEAIARGIYTTLQGITLTVPQGVKGALIEVHVYGATGTFTAGQGLSLITSSRLIGGTSTGHQLTGAVFSSVKNVQHIWYPGISKDDAALGNAMNEIKITGIPIAKTMNVVMNITGTFEAGQGIDCKCSVMWLI